MAQPQLTRPRWPFLFAGILLLMAALACGGSADGVVVLARLPTLTRTPLPTLTPTPNATQLAMALPTVSPAPDSSQNPASAESEMTVAGIAPDAAPINSDNSANAAPAAPVDPAVTDPNTPAPVEAASMPSPPTPTATATATAIPPTPTETAIPTDTPTTTPTPLPEGWVFADMRLGPAPDGRDLLILGNLINNTGSTQILDTIDGLFYDSQGQPLDNTFYTLDYPINEVPQAGRIPFQIQLKDRPNAADFDLQVLAESGGDAPRQDFEFLEVNAAPQGDEYCVAGKVRNPGSELGNYLLVAAVLYNGENKVINYDYDYFDEALPALAGEQTQEISLCVDPLQQEVARAEFEAWGL